ncbi:MAG: HAD family hydrolase [Nitrospirae bacterium]|nr:HAD family hydrolase [Nitrospirota bacterium]
MIEAIIFDFDGVLVESVDIKTKAFQRLFESEGEEVVAKVAEYHLMHGGVSRFDKFRHFYSEFLRRPLTDEIFQELCSSFSNLVKEEVVKAPYVKGAKEFLESNALTYSCFVCTATPHDEIEEILRSRRMNDYFKGVYGAPRSKIDIVSSILSLSDIVAEKTVYVGDAWTDYAAAQANRVKFVARINHNEEIFKDVTCPKINDLTELSDVILLWKNPLKK